MGEAYKKDLPAGLERMNIDLAVADYVYVDSASPAQELPAGQPPEEMRREPEGLSSQTMISWQESLLEDPKNR